MVETNQPCHVNTMYCRTPGETVLNVIIFRPVLIIKYGMKSSCPGKIQSFSSSLHPPLLSQLPEPWLRCAKKGIRHNSLCRACKTSDLLGQPSDRETEILFNLIKRPVKFLCPFICCFVSEGQNELIVHWPAPFCQFPIASVLFSQSSHA